MGARASAEVGTDLYISRRATESRVDGHRDTRLLAEWRDADAYVLLGEPGAGKSESLRAEAKGNDAVYISARDFITLGIEKADVDKTLFIDGLDEMRAGSVDGRVPLDAIRAQLKQLGRPRFRLSCREYDWRAQTDLAALSQVAPGAVVRELHLEPLSRDEQFQLLRARPAEVPDTEAFVRRADQLGLADLFGNPLLLDLTIRAVASNRSWPLTRCAIYELACRELATEHSVAHLDANPLGPGAVDHLLDDAGLLYAVLLLSGKGAITRGPNGTATSISLPTLPAALQFHDVSAALASKVFVTTAGVSAPRHRSVAEYLAGRVIARLLKGGDLPLSRVLALMQGGDGGVVEPLRGLLGWMAVHDHRNREHLIRLDPLAVVLNGDIATFAVTAKHVLLEAIRDEARRNPGFRNRHWVSYPFAPLATRDMSEALAQVLTDHSDDDAHQALVDCVLDTLSHGEPIQQLGGLLEAWVEDIAAQFRNRLGALEAWKHTIGFDAAKARQWLVELHRGGLQDSDGRLAGELLLDLYPKHIGPEEVLRYWPRPSQVDTNTLMPRFWYRALIDQSRPQDFAVLADAWLRSTPSTRPSFRDGLWLQLSSEILAKALELHGDQVSDERLYDWLSIGEDTNGSSKLDREPGGRRVAQWLTDRPERMKALLELGWRAVQPDAKSPQRSYRICEQRLHGAQRPRDWFTWLLCHAGTAPNEVLAKYCFGKVTQAAVDPPPGFDMPTMEQIEFWVEANIKRWPNAGEWLSENWKSTLEDNWQSDDYRRQRKHEAEVLASKESRRLELAPYLDAIVAGTAPPQILHQLAGAYEGRFSDICGDTPVQRVQDFLVSDEANARAAIAALTHVLKRDDLPSANQLLALNAKGRFHRLRNVALLAAQLEHERKPPVVESWPDSLLATLVACWLTEPAGEMPGWYKRIVGSRPAIVAPLLLRHTLTCLRRKGPLFVKGLWEMAHEPAQQALARLVLPMLLERFPHRASEPARHQLNGSMLAELHLLDDEVASAIVRRKLDHPSIDAAQRICWLVAELQYSADAAQHLVDAVGVSERRIMALGIALKEQGSLGRALTRVPPKTLSHLIELLAPLTRPERSLGTYWVTPAHERGDTVRGLVDLLAGDPRPAAGTEIQRLANLPRLEPWREHLLYCTLAQQGVAREAHFVHPSPESAALTLANRAPANRADLVALTLEHLQDIERDLRGADTFALRQYWSKSDDGTRTPIDENDCRDLLLEQLRPRLTPLGVHVIPERRAANEKCVDLRVEFMTGGQPLAVPIEIKKESNKSLWLAWRDQLQALYAIDPAADGHGIYLVLWFGYKPRSSPEGEKPTDAKDLERKLNERVTATDRARLAIRVMDLTLTP